MDNGWVKIHRKILDWEWYTDINVRVLFLHMLIVANHTDNKWQGKLIKRGQLITSLQSLSAGSGLSIMQVRTALGKLKLTGEITNQSTKDYRTITITNYNSYQEDNRRNNSKTTGEITNKQQRGNKPDNNKQEVKNDKNEKNIYIHDELETQVFLESFNEIYETKFKSTRSWAKNFAYWRKVYSLDELVEAVRKAKNHPFWKDKLDPDKLLRSHEDRIGQILNKKERSNVL